MNETTSEDDSVTAVPGHPTGFRASGRHLLMRTRGESEYLVGFSKKSGSLGVRRGSRPATPSGGLGGDAPLLLWDNARPLFTIEVPTGLPAGDSITALLNLLNQWTAFMMHCQCQGCAFVITKRPPGWPRRDHLQPGKSRSSLKALLP